MRNKHFIIKLTEDLVVSGTSGVINRNSNSTQYLDVELDGWKLNEGEVLYIELSHYDDDTELATHVGPLMFIYNEKLKRYVTLLPPELISKAGEWQYSIELRFNIGENKSEEITYNSIASAISTLTVTDSIVSLSPSHSFTKEAELLTAVDALAAAITIGHTYEDVLDLANSAAGSAENAANSEREAKDAAISAEQSKNKAENSMNIAVQAKADSEQAAVESKTAAQIARDCIKGAFVTVENSALVFSNLKNEVSVENKTLILKGGLN